MHPLTPWPGRLRHARLLAVAGVLLALALAHAAPAHAAPGIYIHLGCVKSGDLADAYGGWQPVGSVANGNANTNQCPSGGLRSDMTPTGRIPLGTAVGWKYKAPPNTHIFQLSARYSGWTKPYDVNQGILQFVEGGSHVGFTYVGSGAAGGGWNPIDWSDLHADDVTMQLVCDGPTGNPGCSGTTGWSTLFSPRLYLTDDLPPVGGATSGSVVADETLKGNEGLTYSASDDGGGVARLRLYVDGRPTAVDHAVDANGGHCQVDHSEDGVWVFPAAKPCPGLVNADETVDTTAIPDGWHTISFKVVDAGQREAGLWTGRRLVANHPPVNTQAPLYADQDPAANPLVGHVITASSDGTWTGPDLHVSRAWVQCDGHGTIGSCAAIPGATNLAYTPTAADIGHRLRLSVTATNVADSVTAYSQPTGIVAAPSSAEPITPKPDTGKDTTTPQVTINVPPAAVPVLPSVSVSANVEHAFRGRVAGEPAGATCPQDRATLKFEHVSGGQLKLGFGKASTAQVQLSCTTTGKAIEGAKLDVATRVGSRAAVAADVTTDGAGHAVLRLAKGAGRVVSVGYRMYADDPIARATATLKVTVAGHVSLKANHRHLYNGQAVRLRGALAGGEVPSRGVTLAVQWKDGHRWRPFAQIKTNRKGAFSYAYKFTRTAGKITYALRVQVDKGQVDYPYLATASKPVKVTVAR